MTKPGSSGVELKMAFNDEGEKQVAMQPCTLCRTMPKRNDAVLQVLTNEPFVTVVFHRRCMESLLEESPNVIDGERALAKVERYKQKILQRGLVDATQ